MEQQVGRNYTLRGEVRDAYAAADALERLRRQRQANDEDADEAGIGARTRRDDGCAIGL